MIAIFKNDRVYGNVLIYPVNDTAKKLMSLTGKKTASLADISIFKSLGFKIEVEPQKLGG